MLKEVEKHVDLRGYEVVCALSGCCFRQVLRVGDSHVEARNRRLMELVAQRKDFIGPDVLQNDNWKCVCWSSGNAILNDMRICKVVRSGGKQLGVAALRRVVRQQDLPLGSISDRGGGPQAHEGYCCRGRVTACAGGRGGPALSLLLPQRSEQAIQGLAIDRGQLRRDGEVGCGEHPGKFGRRRRQRRGPHSHTTRCMTTPRHGNG